MIAQPIRKKISAIEIFGRFADKDYSFFLDSSANNSLGQYSFIGANPFLTISSKNGLITISQQNRQKIFEGDPFNELEKLQKKYSSPEKGPTPFTGGAVGYLGYNLCHHIEKLPRKAKDDEMLPDMFFGFYDGIIAIDHAKNKTWAIASGLKNSEQETIQELLSIIAAPLKRKKTVQESKKSKLKTTLNKEQFVQAVNKALKYIQIGDIYQANISTRFSFPLKKEHAKLYKTLRKINPSSFSAWFNFGEATILSSSPERFIKTTGQKIETRPIKGTRARGIDKADDSRKKEELQLSPKDRAELLMIVDLERNDLGKICKAGSVEVDAIYELETHPTLHHLTATVSGTLKPKIHCAEIFRATFPGGSITGAPKIRSMEIIDEIEPTQRSIYTGSIGYINHNGDMDLNIAIRTMVLKKDMGYFQAGSGIVADSCPVSEHKETLTKAKALIATLEK